MSVLQVLGIDEGHWSFFFFIRSDLTRVTTRRGNRVRHSVRSQCPKNGLLVIFNQVGGQVKLERVLPELLITRLWSFYPSNIFPSYCYLLIGRMFLFLHDPFQISFLYGLDLKLSVKLDFNYNTVGLVSVFNISLIRCVFDIDTLVTT